MSRILFLSGAMALAGLTAGCGGYTERTQYAYAPPGAVYYGDRAPASTYYVSPRTGYAYPSNAYPSTTGYYYSQGDYYRNYRGIHSPPERNM
ncbi:MAG: hypothetical protein KIT82_21195 [Bradyrhizobium sp.]|nr:hypothetical protein [Bradyrhizobium sp.]